MQKRKVKEMARVAVVSVLSVGLFSAAFIGSNELVFAFATNKTADIVPVAVTAENSAPDNYRSPELTVVNRFGREIPGEKDLSSEKATELGAQYVWEVFGEDMDGYTVDAGFYDDDNGGLWRGRVGESESALENRDILYTFEIDATSGERVGIRNIKAMRNGEDSLPKKSIPYDDYLNLVEEPSENLAEDFVEDLDKYSELAKEYAQKHFSNTRAVNVTFHKIDLNGRTERGNREVFEYNQTMLSFIVTDDAGQSAEVELVTETDELSMISARISEPGTIVREVDADSLEYRAQREADWDED